ncbi:hypothetical protein GCM10010387_61690 [Streptomyces inusitatus]|uniref:Lipoprotein n=1 Tax=Streptomyces inusitatus TaxID=68221 RepID=A0A918QPV5_9ACTN|nr:hypothetical protein [Streptomyces inusitatus]GGZ59601.1 hypothetical protein GCM10010387_61690 [Streptomyces inusitatus]
MTIRFRVRHTAVAMSLAAASLLLTGCGEGGDSTGKERGAPAEGERAPAAALTPAEVKAVLPRAGDLPRWKAVSSAVLDLSEGHTERACPGGTAKECMAARHVGTAVLEKDGEGRVEFKVFAHKDTDAASDAYPFLWKDASKGWLSPAEKASIGTPGDRRDALRGEHETGYGSNIQIRVGPTLLSIRADTGADRPRRTDAELTALAKMFAERARQAHEGELPSAVLRP